MSNSQGDALARYKFIELEKKYSKLEDKFDEMRERYGG
jgi:hypothetical protein